MSRVKRLASGAISLILFVAILEGMARVDDWWSFLTTGRPTSPGIGQIEDYDANGSRMRPNTAWRGITFNRYGFNNRDDFTYTQRAHRWRILVLGDSIAEGTSSGADGGNWPQMVEDDLQKAGWDVEVLNAAAPGNTLEHAVNRLESEWYQFHPDIIVVQKESRSLVMPSPTWTSNRILPLRLTSSALVSKLVSYRPADVHTALTLQRIRFGLWQTVPSVPPSALESYATQVDRLVGATQAKLMLVTVPLVTTEQNYAQHEDIGWNDIYFWPWIDNPHVVIQGSNLMNDYLVARAAAHPDQFTTVDLRPVIPATDQYFRDTMHYTRQGNETAAQAIAEQLIPLLQQVAAKP